MFYLKKQQSSATFLTKQKLFVFDIFNQNAQSVWTQQDNVA